MSKKKNIMKKITLCVTCTLLGAISAISMQSFADSGKDSLPVQDLRTLAEVYAQIKANYYQETTNDKLIQGAVKGMVHGLDPHSEYLLSKDFEDLKEHTTGEFGGLGMEIGKKNDAIVVIAPIEDTPAERAGLQSGDYIIKINDESTRGMSTTEAVKLMRGKPGTDINLTITRENSSVPIEVKITRAMIQVKSVRSKLLEEGYAYIRISQFQERTTQDLVNHIKELTKQNKGELKGLVLDLRDNPGGLLNQAVGVSAVFLKKGDVVVSTKGRDGRNATSHRADRSGYLLGRNNQKDPLEGLPEEVKKLPLTVLINSGSASASEIVTGALQDYKRAVILGVSSFGKGSVQSVMPLSNGSGIKLTIALYYTPHDRSIQAQGIVPDIEVKDKRDAFQMREADLSGHLNNPFGGEENKGKIDEEASNLKKEDAKEKTDDEKFDELLSRRDPNPEKDDVLKKALEVLKDSQLYQDSIGLAEKEGRNKVDEKKISSNE